MIQVYVVTLTKYVFVDSTQVLHTSHFISYYVINHNTKRHSVSVDVINHNTTPHSFSDGVINHHTKNHSYLQERPRFTVRYCRMTVGQSIRLPGKQTDFDFAVGQCLVSYENRACQISIRHNTLSNGDVKVCLSYDSVGWWR